MADETLQTPLKAQTSNFDQKVRDEAAKLKSELIRQTLDDLDSWEKAVNTEWAKAHPGESTSPKTGQEAEKYRNIVRNEYYEWVIPAFERCLRPDPDDSDSAIRTFEKLKGRFTGTADSNRNIKTADPALNLIADVRIEMMSHWEGALADNFINHFADPLQSVTLNQGPVAEAVTAILKENKIMYIRFRLRVLDLLDKAIKAVQACNHDKDPQSYKWRTLFGTAISAVLAVGSGGVLAGAVVLNVVSTLAQGYDPPSGKVNELSAPTAQEIAFKVYESLNGLQGQLFDNECSIRDALSGCFATISQARTPAVSGNKDGPFSVAVPDVNHAQSRAIVSGLRPHH